MIGWVQSDRRSDSMIDKAVAAILLGFCVLVGSAYPAIASQCASLARLAQQSAAYYRSSGDEHHSTAARNYQNAYNGCVSATRQRTSAAIGRTAHGAMSAFNVTLNVLGVFSSLSRGDAERKAREHAVAEESRRQEELVRQQEIELQRELKAARQAQEAKERQARLREQERLREQARLAALATLRSRCAKSNPFGRDVAECEPFTAGTSPFATPDAASGNAFAVSDNDAPDWDRGRHRGNTFDSVKGVDCPDMFVRGCIPDGWRQMLSRLEHDHGGDINAALVAAYDRQQAAYKAGILYTNALSESQYRRLGTGEATFADIEREINALDLEPVTLGSLLQKLAEIENDPNTKRQFENAMRDMVAGD